MVEILKKLFSKLIEHYKRKKQFKNYDFLDKFNIYHNEYLISICIIFVCLYMTRIFSTVRNAVSDTITFSSIILGIIGVLIGILIGLEENSRFFNRAKKFKKDGLVYNGLIKKMGVAFLTNIIFITFTVAFDIIPSTNILIIKSIALTAWVFLFLKTIWQVCFLIIIIIKIATFVEEKNLPVKKRS